MAGRTGKEVYELIFWPSTRSAIFSIDGEIVERFSNIPTIEALADSYMPEWVEKIEVVDFISTSAVETYKFVEKK